MIHSPLFYCQDSDNENSKSTSSMDYSSLRFSSLLSTPSTEFHLTLLHNYPPKKIYIFFKNFCVMWF